MSPHEQKQSMTEAARLGKLNATHGGATWSVMFSEQMIIWDQLLPLCIKSFETSSGHGHPCRKSWTSTSKSVCVRDFSANPVMGFEFLHKDRGLGITEGWGISAGSPDRRVYVHIAFPSLLFEAQKRHFSYHDCNFCGHLQRRQCPTLKTAEKGAEWVTVNSRKTAGRTAETPEKTDKTAVFRMFRLFWLFFGLFYRDLLGILFGCFFGCFQCQAFGTSVDGRRDCNITRCLRRVWSQNFFVLAFMGIK